MAGTHGGARPGAGRKPKPTVVIEGRDPLEFLLDVMQGKVEARPEQLKAAIAATQYIHAKKGEGGKKGERAERAKEVGAGKFSSAPPPLKLVRDA